MDFGWTTSNERHQIAKKFETKFMDDINKAGILQENPNIKKMYFISGEELLYFDRLPKYENYKNSLFEYPNNSKINFVSYRWLNKDNPDPDGLQLELLKKYVNKNEYYWIDFCCLPQNQLLLEEKELFKNSFETLPSLFYESNFIILRRKNDDYFNRAWCFLEFIASITISKNITYIYEDSNLKTDELENEVKAINNVFHAKNYVNSLLVTRDEDKVPIEKMVNVLSLFFKLNIIMHYLYLGIRVSRGNLFFGHSPYYHLSVCDFSDVIEWVFKKSKEHNLPINLLNNDENSENYFVLLASMEEFPKTFNPYSFPKKVTLDIESESWFILNKNYPPMDISMSEKNLFFILTSLLK